ncbi:MAG TPA: DNA-3-methyladenine glycosylase [Patescibacteria group bacterium]|nr:DNA-3-methyladenine glycosylase [Patescibacteria group bacterium]
MYSKAIKHLKTNDPILHEIALSIEPFELSIHPDPFIRLIRSIIGQQLSVKAAATIFARFEDLFPNKEIEPNYILKIPDEKLRSVGLSRQKISYLKDLSQKVIEKEVELENLQELESEVIIEQLLKIKGIGRWTAEMFLMFSLGRPDIFSNGDLGLQNAIRNIYKLSNKPTIEEMEKISNKWSPYRTYASMILWRSLNNEPK